jgi:hypothetical protein
MHARSLINVSPRTRTTKQNLEPRCMYVHAGKKVFTEFNYLVIIGNVVNKTENHFSPYPRSRINLYTRLKILLIAGKA